MARAIQHSTAMLDEACEMGPACACVRACVRACVLDGHRFGVRECAETVLLAALLCAERVQHDLFECEVREDSHRCQTDGPRATCILTVAVFGGDRAEHASPVHECSDSRSQDEAIFWRV